MLLTLAALLEGTRSALSFIDSVPPTVHVSLWVLAVTSLLHVLMIWGEVSLTHPTAHARLAVWEIVHGRYQSEFWIGILLSIFGGLLPWLAIFGYVDTAIGIGGAPLALIGLMLFEHAYVQAGQSVPLA